MIPLAEFIADFDKGHIQMFTAQIHGHMPGSRDVFGSCFGNQLLPGQTVIIGDGTDDFGSGQIVFINGLSLTFESGDSRFEIDENNSRFSAPSSLRTSWEKLEVM